jgi:DnaK suppressor protein
VDPDRARQRLAEERARAEEELAGIGEDPAPDEPQDPGEQSVELDQEERDAALREQLRDRLAAIERAEQRLEDGSFGVSVVSGDPIPDARLEAIPWAERTVEEEERTP